MCFTVFNAIPLTCCFLRYKRTASRAMMSCFITIDIDPWSLLCWNHAVPVAEEAQRRHWYLRVVDIQSKALTREVLLSHPTCTIFEVIIDEMIFIPRCPCLACTMQENPALGLFDMQTGVLQQIHQTESCCPHIAHVPSEHLIVKGMDAGLSLFNVTTLAFEGSVRIAGLAVGGRYSLTSILGSLPHHCWTRCCIVGDESRGLRVVDVATLVLVAVRTDRRDR